MSMGKLKTKDVVDKFRRHESDTGSPEVQIALNTERINELADHFKTHPKDRSSHRGLIKLINQRRKLLQYLREQDAGRYAELISRLGLRK